MDVKMVILVPVTKVSNLGRIRTGLTDILEFWKFWILFANLLTNMLALYRWLNRKEIGCCQLFAYRCNKYITATHLKVST